MKHIRLLSLSLALVLLVALFASCGKTPSGSESGSDAQSSASASQSGADVSAPGDANQSDASAPDASQEEDAPQTPETKPGEKPQTKPEAPAPQPKPEEKPEVPAPGEDSDETVLIPLPGVKPAAVDLAAFYETIFTDPANAPALIPMEGETLDAFYPGLTALSLKQKVAYMPMMTAVPCEIVMVECANSSDVGTVKSIFQSRIDSQVNNHFNYPMVIEAWETEAKVASNGNFVALFVVSGMTDQVVSNFNALF